MVLGAAAHPPFGAAPGPPCPIPNSRKVVQGVGAGPRPHQHAVHLPVQPVEEEPQELLGVLLAARQGGRGGEEPSRGGSVPSPHAPRAKRPLLVADEAGGVSLDLRLELGGADALVGGRGPEQLDQLGEFCVWRCGSGGQGWCPLAVPVPFVAPPPQSLGVHGRGRGGCRYLP